MEEKKIEEDTNPLPILEVVKAFKITKLMHRSEKVKVVKLIFGLLSQIVGLWYAFYANLKDLRMCDSWYNIEDLLVAKKQGEKGKRKSPNTVGALHSFMIWCFKLETRYEAMG